MQRITIGQSILHYRLTSNMIELYYLNVTFLDQTVLKLVHLVPSTFSWSVLGNLCKPLDAPRQSWASFSVLSPKTASCAARWRRALQLLLHRHGQPDADCPLYSFAALWLHQRNSLYPAYSRGQGRKWGDLCLCLRCSSSGLIWQPGPFWWLLLSAQLSCPPFSFQICFPSRNVLMGVEELNRMSKSPASIISAAR